MYQRTNMMMRQQYGSRLRVLFIGMALVTGLSIGLLMVYMPSRQSRSTDIEIQFYVLGDSQGYTGGLREVIDAANLYRPDFVFHLGDLTPCGQESQYDSLEDVLSGLTVPFHTTAGNHDIRLGGALRFRERFGPANYSFDVGRGHFTVLDTSTGDVDESQIEWFERDITQTDADWKFVFTHMPLSDPVTGMDHALLNDTTALRLMRIIETAGVDAVFAGHIHIYNRTERDGVQYVISGGAGISLYADEARGGIYHYVNVTVGGGVLTIRPVILSPPVITRDQVSIITPTEGVTLTLADLMALPQVQGVSSFQNQFGNWAGHGLYTGTRVATLLEAVGDLPSQFILVVVAADGYEQYFSSSNVYPNETWHMLQGEMVLAYSLNGTTIPAWQDGLRLVMLPEDERYSNEDCQATSEPGQGYHVYPSAGARWVRNVIILRVIPA